MKLDVETARELAYGIPGTVYEGYEVVEDEMVDTTRWSIWFRLVVKDLETGKYWVTSYAVGATEIQEERPFEHNEPEFFEVAPVVVYKTEYRSVS